MLPGIRPLFVVFLFVTIRESFSTAGDTKNSQILVQVPSILYPGAINFPGTSNSQNYPITQILRQPSINPTSNIESANGDGISNRPVTRPLTFTTNNHRTQFNLAKKSAEFASKLYKDFVGRTNGNILLAPFSLQTIFALIQMGSNGKTLTEIARTLSMPTDKNVLGTMFKSIKPTLKSYNPSEYNSANKIYVQDNFQILQNFTEVARNSFGAEFESKNFKNSFKTVQDINQWVKTQTNGKISNLLTPDQISELTRMVLINTLYFNGQWKNMFDPKWTMLRPFQVNPTTTKEIEMMAQEMTAKLSYDPQLNAKFLELPYSGNKFTMTFVLANKKGGLEALERNLEKVLEPQRTYNDVEMNVLLPKFKIENSIDLKDILQRLGIIEVFSPKANLSEMVQDDRDLYVSDVIQKTFIEINEKGTIGSAATSAVATDRITKPSFYANHPFLFILKETTTNTVQFIGRFTGE